MLFLTESFLSIFVVFMYLDIALHAVAFCLLSFPRCILFPLLSFLSFLLFSVPRVVIVLHVVLSACFSCIYVVFHCCRFINFDTFCTLSCYTIVLHASNSFRFVVVSGYISFSLTFVTYMSFFPVLHVGASCLLSFFTVLHVVASFPLSFHLW